jgi:hypothetical protein
MAKSTKKKNLKVRDLKLKKDVKGGGHTITGTGVTGTGVTGTGVTGTGVTGTGVTGTGVS